MKSLARFAPAKSSQRCVLGLSIASLLASSLLITSSADAATYNWQIAGTTNTWSTAAGEMNWFIDAGTTLSPWANSNDAVFNAATGETVTLSGTVLPTSIAVGANNGSWVFSGAGSIGGTGTLTKSGTGTLTLSTANTYSGGTIVTAGTLSLGTTSTPAGTYAFVGPGALTTVGQTANSVISLGGAVGASTTLSNSLPLGIDFRTDLNVLSGSASTGRDVTVSGLITGGAADAVRLYINTDTGNGSLGVVKLTNAANSFLGNIQINRGGLAITSDGALGDASNTLTIDIGTTIEVGLRFDAAMSSARAISILSGKQVFDTNVNAVTLSGVISGAGQFFKSGVGTLTLTNTNTYTGGTVVNAGTLNLDYSTNSGSKIGGALTLAGGNLNLSGGSTVQAATSTTLNSGASSINQTNSGTSTITLAGITRSAGSTLDLGTGGIAATSSALGGANSLATTSLGVLGAVGGNDWIARNATTGLVGYSTVASYAPTTSSAISGNADVTLGVTATTLASGGSASTIRFNQNQATTITNTTGTLSLTQGGILVTSTVGSNTSTITGGTLTSGSNDALFILQNNTTGGLTISSVVADRSQTGNSSYTSDTLTKSGAGTLTLGGVNTYSGQTYLNGGTTVISADSGIGGANGTIAVVSSTLASTSVTYSGSLPAGLGIGTSLLGSTITAINDSTKVITLAAGGATTALTNGTASWANAQALNLNGGTLQTTATTSLTESNAGGTTPTTAVNRTVVLGGNGGTFNTDPSTTVTVGGVISGVGGLTKNGIGTLTLSGANTFTGGMTISGVLNSQTTGSVVLGNNSALGTGAVTLTNTATSTALFANAARTIANNIALSPSAVQTHFVATDATTFQLDGLISGGNAGGTFFVDTNLSGGSTGVVKLTNAANSFLGKVQVNRGGVAINSDGALGNSANSLLIDIGTGTQVGLRFDAAVSTARAIALGSGKQVFDTNGNAVTLSGAISGSSGQLFKSGAGILTLTSANTYGGTTIVSTGTLSVSSLNKVSGGSASSSLGAPTTLANGTIGLGSLANTGTLSYTGAGETTDRVIDLAGTTGGATLDQSGTTGLLKFTSALTATGAGSKTLTLQGSTAGSGEIAGAIVDNSGTNKTSVTKAGTGTWTLSGVSNYVGPTQVSSGTLEVSGSIGGTVGVGTAINVDTNGTLLLSGFGTDRVGNDSSLTLNGGILRFANTSGGGLSEGMNSLALSSSPTLDFGTGTTGDTLTFGSLTWSMGASDVFKVYNWSGTLSQDNGSIGDTRDRLLFTIDPVLDPAKRSQISFYSGGVGTEATTFLGNGGEISFGGQYEIVAVPEPSSTALLAASTLLALVGFLERRRFRSLGCVANCS